MLSVQNVQAAHVHCRSEPRRGGGQFKGGIDDLHKRFREGEVAVFKKNGVDVLAVWQNLDDPNTLVYLLAYKDRAAR